jgi:signal peptidase I
MTRLSSMSRRRVTALVVCAALLGSIACTLAYAWAHGYRMYVVETGSMTPSIMAGDVVIDRTPVHGYERGDVITVQISAAGDMVTHRMTRLDAHGRVHTKGDANEKADAWALRQEQVRGVVKQKVPNLGYLIVFMRQPEGVAGVMTSALSLFLLWGICFPQESRGRSAARVRGAEPVPGAGPLPA